MDKTPPLIPKKKRKTEIDFNLCFICQKNSKSKIIVKAATIESIDKVLNNIKERYKFKDVSVLQLAELLGDKNLQDIVNNNGFYHRQCYQDITNKETLKKAEKRFNKVIQRPSMTNLTERKEERVIRSESVPYEKSHCIICQKIDGKLHKVETKETGQKMLEVSQKLPDKGMLGCSKKES